jgi:hypothetical protein
VRGIVLFLALWIVSLAFLGPLLVGFVRTGYLELGGTPLEGAEGFAVAAILALIPITLLALGIERIYRYFSNTRA